MQESEPQRVLVRLRPDFEALGMVLDLLSRTPPFAQYDLDQISAAIRMQLKQQHHVAALEGGQLIGYMGWLLTTAEIARRWAEDEGPLRPMPPEQADAVCVTILASPNSRVLRRLVSQGRAQYATIPVFFKRQSGDRTRKVAVTSMNFRGS